MSSTPKGHQCVARPTVAYPASERHRPLTDTKLYFYVTEAHRCKYSLPRATAQ